MTVFLCPFAIATNGYVLAMVGYLKNNQPNICKNAQ